jgi:hypothetical protein
MIDLTNSLSNNMYKGGHNMTFNEHGMLLPRDYELASTELRGQKRIIKIVEGKEKGMMS